MGDALLAVLAFLVGNVGALVAARAVGDLLGEDRR